MNSSAAGWGDCYSWRDGCFDLRNGAAKTKLTRSFMVDIWAFKSARSEGILLLLLMVCKISRDSFWHGEGKYV